jgi:hypothetical protein
MTRRSHRPLAFIAALLAGLGNPPYPAADPAQADGAVAAIEGRGVVFVRVAR